MCDSVSTCVPQIEGMRYSHTMITYVEAFEGIGFGSSNSKVSLTLLLHTLCIFFYHFYFNYTVG